MGTGVAVNMGIVVVSLRSRFGRDRQRWLQSRADQPGRIKVLLGKYRRSGFSDARHESSGTERNGSAAVSAKFRHQSLRRCGFSNP